MSYLSAFRTTTTPTSSFIDLLNDACNKAYPDLTIPGSWADIMDFADKYIAENNPSYRKSIRPSIPKETSPRRKQDSPKRNSYSPRNNSYNRTKRNSWSPQKPKRVYIRNDVPNISLIIKNLPTNPKVNELTDIFEVYGEVDYIRLVKRGDGLCGGIGFVTFKTMEGSACAYAPLHKIPYQNRTVYTEYVRNRY